MHQRSKQEWHKIRSQINHILKIHFNIEDTSGIDLFTTLQRVSHLIDVMENKTFEDPELSGARWRIILTLFITEKMGMTNGMTPTALSYSQNVSKNTISSLLRGLEEQGLIQRTMDPDDLRIFRIQLTPSGRELAVETGPQRIENVNHLVSGLDQGERLQLSALLDKLSHSLLLKLHSSEKERDRYQAGSYLSATTEEEIRP